MKRLINSIQAWFRRWRREQAFKKHKDEMLREFVYLDEVSVYSLLASRLGSIASEFTETETKSLEGEVGSLFGANIAPVTTAGVNSRVSSIKTNSSQVLRKSIIQTQFKEFYDYEVTRNSLEMKPIDEKLLPPRVKSFDDLIVNNELMSKPGWIVDPTKLVRGALLEMEVELEADSIFGMTTLVSSMSEIIEESPEMFGFAANDGLAQMKSIQRILARLLVGLVPVRGIAVDYKVVKRGEKEWIIHQRLLDEFSGVVPTRPLYIVGVAEQSLFWKDIRLILFSKLHFRVLCRLTQSGIKNSWTPVKLEHVLGKVIPGFADQIATFGTLFGTFPAKANNSDQKLERKQEFAYDALVVYAKLLAEHYGHSITDQDLLEANLPAEQHYQVFGNVRERRASFEAMSEFVLKRFNLERDSNVIAEYREKALQSVGLDVSGQPIMKQEALVSPSSNVDERFLDSEIIAIYW